MPKWTGPQRARRMLRQTFNFEGLRTAPSHTHLTSAKCITSFSENAGSPETNTAVWMPHRDVIHYSRGEEVGRMISSLPATSVFSSCSSISLPHAFSPTSIPTTMSVLIRAAFSRRVLALQSRPRAFTTSTLLRADPPPGNQPPSAKSAGRQSHVSSDSQSSASNEEHKTGDDHPAKQPDSQAPSDRSTGFKEGTSEVKGGKEGLGQRTET